jgi:hypothetical protein
MTPYEDDTSIVLSSDNEEDDVIRSHELRQPVAKHELTWIRYLHVTVFLLLAVITIIASFLIYRIAKRYEDDLFRNNVSAGQLVGKDLNQSEHLNIFWTTRSLPLLRL